MRTILLRRQGGNGRLIWSKLLAVLIFFIVPSRVKGFLGLARILMVYPSSRMMIPSSTRFRLPMVATNDDDAEPQYNHINTDRGSSVDNLAHQFINCTLPKEEWTHEAHLQVGLWHVLHYHDDDDSSTASAPTTITVLDVLRERIQRYNVATGGANTNSSGYHETLTQFYVSQIDHFVEENVKKAVARDEDFKFTDDHIIYNHRHDIEKSELQEAMPMSRTIDELADELIANYGDRQLPLQYWSPETLFSIKARQHWMEPDLKELPFDVLC